MRIFVTAPFQNSDKLERCPILFNNEIGASLGEILGPHKNSIRSVWINGEQWDEWELFIGGKADRVEVLAETGFLQAVVGLLISLALHFILQALFPAPKKPRDIRAQPAFAIAGIINTTAPGTRKFFVIGERDVHGHLILSKTSLTDRVAGDLYRRMTFDIVDFMGCGPIRSIAAPKINGGTSILDIPGGGYEVRLGTEDQTIFTGFEHVHQCYSIGLTIPMPSSSSPDANKPIVKTTKGVADKLTLSISFPGGVYGTVKKGKNVGAINTGAYDYEVWYKKNSTTEWIHARGNAPLPVYGWHFQAATKDGLFAQIEIEFPDRDRYDYKIQNTSTGRSDQESGATILVNAQETQYITTAYPGDALLHICGIGSEQINNLESLERSAVEKGVIVDVWDTDHQMMIQNWTRSRTWLCRYIALSANNALGASFPPDMWDDGSSVRAMAFERAQVPGYDGLEDRDYCDEIIGDAKPGWQWLRELTFEGDARLIPSDGRLKYIVDRGGEGDLTYAPGENIIEGTLKPEFGQNDTRPNVLYATFPNVDQDYKEVPARLFKRGGLAAGEAERPETIAFGSIVRPSQAARRMRRYLDEKTLKKRFWSWQSPHEALVSEPFDPAWLSYDITSHKRGFSGKVGEGSTASLLVLDSLVTLEPATTYTAILVHRGDNTNEQKTVSSAAGKHASVTVSSPFATAPTPGDYWIIGIPVSQIPKILIDDVKATPERNYEIKASVYLDQKYQTEDPLPNILEGINTSPAATVCQQPIVAQVVGDVPNNRVVFNVAPGFNSYRGSSQETTADYIQLAASEPAVDEFFTGYIVDINVGLETQVSRRVASYSGADRKAYFEADSDPGFRGVQTYRLTARGPGTFAGYSVERSTASTGPWTALGSTATTEFLATGYATSTNYFRLTPASTQGFDNEVGRWVLQLAAGDSTAPAAPASVAISASRGLMAVTVVVPLPLARDARRINIELNQNSPSGTNITTATIDLSRLRNEDNNTGTDTLMVTLDLSAQTAGTIVFARAQQEDWFKNKSAWVDSASGAEVAVDDLNDQLDTGTNPAEVTVSNTITATTLAKKAIPGGGLGLDGIAFLTAFLKVTDSDPANNATLTLRGKLGGTTIATMVCQTSDGIISLGTDVPWEVRLTLANDNSSSAHKCQLKKEGDELSVDSQEPHHEKITLPGMPPAGIRILRDPVSTRVTFPAGLPHSHGVVEVAPTADWTAKLLVALAASPNLFTQIGTMTILAGEFIATFDFPDDQVLDDGDVLVFETPTQDATLSDLGVSIAGMRAGPTLIGKVVRIVDTEPTGIDLSATKDLEITAQWSIADSTLSVTKRLSFNDYILNAA